MDLPSSQRHRLAEAGQVSIHLVNVSGSLLVAPFGGIDRRMSTNPIAIGVPLPDEPPLILDFATSLVAEGKALDLMQSSPLLGVDTPVTGSEEYGPTAGSDVVVITAGSPRRPGMSRDEVVAEWGEPVTERTLGEWSYLYFRNGCEIRCGTYDIVMLQGGQVVDAVVRAPNNAYSGVSSSPPDREAESADSLHGNILCDSPGSRFRRRGPGHFLFWRQHDRRRRLFCTDEAGGTSTRRCPWPMEDKCGES